jgi:serine/threonine protein kinase
MLSEVSSVEFLPIYLKGSIHALQVLHASGISHGGLEPLTIDIHQNQLVEGSLNTEYAAPEIALGLAIVEHYDIDTAVRMWKESSIGLKCIERWLPHIAEEYTREGLRSLIGRPIPEQQSDIWSLGLSYLRVYNDLFERSSSKQDTSHFFELLSPMLRLHRRTLPIIADVHIELPKTVETVETVFCPPGSWKLTEPIRHGELNKTRRSPRS